MSKTTVLPTELELQHRLSRLYWPMRMGIAFIWIWTAIASWFFFPHADSIDWLRRVGLVRHAEFWLLAACLFDLAMGFAAGLMASRLVWKVQILAVMLYSVVMVIYLPEFLFQPFGPVTKNMAVLGCLAYLTMVEKR